MNTIPSVFSFKSSEVRTVVVNDEPWFVAADVCAVLGMKNHREAIRHLDEDEKGVISNDTLGGAQKISIINESGLYALVLRSRKPEAKPFIKWVTKEVLPAIRKTGRYEIPGTQKALPGKLTAESQDLIKAAVRQRVESLPKEKWGSASVTLWGAINTKFGTRGVKDGYKNIPDEALSECLSLIARTPLAGEYLPADKISGEQLDALILDLLCKQRFSLSFIPLEHGLLKPQIHTHHINAQTLVPQAVINDVRDRSFNFFPDALIPDLINAIGDRMAGANR